MKANWKTGRVTVEITARNDTGSPCEKEVPCVIMFDDAPRPICTASARRTLPPGETTFELSFDVPGFKLWSVDTPNVYTLTVGGYSTRFGFRDFRVEKGWFTLNGKRIFLKSAHTGNHLPGGLAVLDAATPELEFRDFQNMKAMGYNCVRFIATQATPRQLDYCDRLGLMVYQETYASWCLADSPHARRRFLDSMRCEMKRDRNHPSLTIWGPHAPLDLQLRSLGSLAEAPQGREGHMELPVRRPAGSRLEHRLRLQSRQREVGLRLG